jgi:glycosyltransferase involved in cell wall biosynthesis
MVRALLLKLNGWPDTFDERAAAIASSIDELIIVRPKPLNGADTAAGLDNAIVYNLRPRRGAFVSPSWLRPIVFPLHVLQAILVMTYLFVRGRLPPVVHALDYALGGLAGAVFCRLFSVPFVVSVRGLKEPRYRAHADEEQTMRARASYYILRPITRLVLTSADHMITKAEYQVEFVRESVGVNPGFSTVPTGVDFGLFDPERTTRPRRSSLVSELSNGSVNDDDLIVLYLGKLIPEKGPQKVLQHLGEVEDELPSGATFAFVGEFRGAAFERRFKELRRGVDSKVFLHPDRIPFQDVPGLLNTVDATVLLAEGDSEGVPRTLQESCAMQTPIIASDVTGISGAFDDLPGCYLIDRDSSEEFRMAVNEALLTPPEMPRDQFASRFDMFQNYSKYAKIYETLAAGDAI